MPGDRTTVRKELDELLKRKTQERDRREEDAVARDPAIGELLRRRRNVALDAYAQTLERGKAPDKDEIRAARDKIDREITARLAALGLPADTLQMQYDCPLCKDRGYVGDANRRDCECFTRRLEALRLAHANLDMAGSDTFDGFREDIFPDTPLAGHTYSQRALICRARDLCMTYCREYPNNRLPNLLLAGQTGLGKTFLVNCIANALHARNVSVCYLTAYRMLEAMRDKVLDRDDEPFSILLNAEVLIIDDLGTEPLYRNITVEMLYNLLNERMRTHRHTIIATNLSFADLENRYGERVLSRLANAEQTLRILLEGQDIRTRRG